MDAGTDGAAQMEEHEQSEDRDRDDDPDDDHPSGSASGRSAVGTPTGLMGRVVATLLLVHLPSLPPPRRPARRKANLSRQGVSVKPACIASVGAYTSAVPKLWTETIETHRREVRDAILDTTAALVAEHGLLGVTMSQIAAETGIGRATLYKYFPDVESILLAWHDRQIEGHLAYLAEISDRADGARERLEAVLEAYALLSRHSPEHHDAGLSVLLHAGEHVARAQRQVHELIRDLVGAAAKAGEIRDDVPPDELASYCVNALAGLGAHRSKAAVHRIVAVVLDGLRPVG